MVLGKKPAEKPNVLYNSNTDFHENSLNYVSSTFYKPELMSVIKQYSYGSNQDISSEVSPSE